MRPEALVCDDDLARRRELREHGRSRGVSGLGSVEVLLGDADEPPSLLVSFIGAAPSSLPPERFVIEGGRSSTPPPRVVAIRRGETSGGDDRVRLALEGEHDRSIYTLRLLTPPGSQGTVDPRHDRVSFSFDLDCPRIDCTPCGSDPDPRLALAPREAPEIDYLAKDYASFRRLMLDRLSLLVPEWTERHEADLGVMLVELMAYVGDHLSYQQDAVATEAYVGTARQRISIRRHGRLVDHSLHEGCNARAWVHVTVEGAQVFSSSWDRIAFATTSTDAAEVFLPLRVGDAAELRVHAALNEVVIYTWGERDCCMPRGATSATLELPEGLLRPGDFLLLEEALGPRTGRPSDADPDRRHVVRLTHVEPVTDPLHPQRALVEVEWRPEDALPFPLCLSTLTAPPECAVLHGVSVARGNVFLVDHGQWVGPEPLGTVPLANVPDRCDGPGRVAAEPRFAGRFGPSIRRTPLTFRAPLPPDDPCLPEAEAFPPAAALLQQDPRRALPQIELLETDPRLPGEPWRWSSRADLLESGPGERHFVVEIDDDGAARLRFGDGVLGRRPTACATMTARYRLGNGPAGNVGRETITHVRLLGLTLDGVTLGVRNPLAARGGTAQESMEDARQLIAAPQRQELLRAITADDYETIAEREVAGLQAASAERLWNGSWYEIQVALDPAGRDDVDDVLLCRARRVLERVRRIGHDVDVTAAIRVPLRIALRICAEPRHLRAHVRTAVLRALGRGLQPDGTRGYFHPDELTFGEPVRLSRLVARVGAVEGVASVRVERFERLFAGPRGELEQGFIPLGRMEIARLDNDPVRPEHGILDVTVEGGR